MMKRLIVFIFFTGIINANAQTRMFLSFGGSTSFGGNLTTQTSISGNLAADLEWDKKVMGTLHVVSGLSTFGASYSTSDSYFGSQSSKYSAQYLGVPLLARWNVANRNFVYVDMGLVSYYLASAHLTETITKFGSTETSSGNVAPYLNRFYIGFKFQVGYSVGRFSFSDFFLYQFSGQQSINNLAEHWAFNPQQSTFLLSNGYSNFRLFGIKITYRIR